MGTDLNYFLYLAKSRQKNRNLRISTEGISYQEFIIWVMGKWRILTWVQRQHKDEQLQEMVTTSLGLEANWEVVV